MAQKLDTQALTDKTLGEMAYALEEIHRIRVRMSEWANKYKDQHPLKYFAEQIETVLHAVEHLIDIKAEQ